MIKRVLCIAVVFISSVSATAAAETLRVLCVGQSNMEGRLGPASSRFQYPTLPDIRSWNYVDDIWEQAVLGELPFAMNRKNTRPANNICYVFAQKVHDELDYDVDIILLAPGGARIEYFLPPSVLEQNQWANTDFTEKFGDSLSDELFNEAGDARIALPAGLYYDVVLMHQGEANFNRDQVPIETAQEYTTKLNAFVTQLYDNLLVGPESVIVFGNINPKYEYADIHRQALQDMADLQTGVVEWRGLRDVEDYHNDGRTDRHATGWGMNSLADRYFQKYLELSGK